MYPRVEPRFKKRMSCRLSLGPSSYSGMVLDLSRTGLFIQTSAGARPGAEIAVNVHSAGFTTPIALSAQVVWQRRVPQQLRTVVKGGIGLKIQRAPESYYRLLADVSRGSPTRGR